MNQCKGRMMRVNLLRAHLRLSSALWGGLITILLLVAACNTNPALVPDAEGAQTTGPAARAGSSTGRLLTIGDISDEPVKKIERFKPLADYLAVHLADRGFTGGRVIVASDFSEMAELIEEGKVDIYMDSPYPVLKVQELADTDFILRRWKDGDSSYYSIIVGVDGEASGLVNALSGQVVAGEEERSTSGYALPVVQMLASGLKVQIVPGPETAVPAGTVGVWFTRDEENTIDALANGFARFAMFSNQDLAGVPEELRSRLYELDRTGTVPRQIVSVSPQLDEQTRAVITDLLTGLEEADGGLEMLEMLKTVRFDSIPHADLATLSEFAELLPAVP